MPALQQSRYTLRAAPEADADACAALIRACDAVECPDDVTTWTADDIRGDWAWLNRETDTWLAVTPDGEIGGYATLTSEDEHQYVADGYVHPQHRGRGIGTTLIHATEARAREQAAAQGTDQPVTVVNNVLATSPAACALLERHGYTRTRIFWRMRIDMDAAPPSAIWPEGITVRSCQNEADMRLAHDATEVAFADHWNHTLLTYDRAGMRVVTTIARYEKTITPPRDSGTFWLYM
jgi:mycothiol synthase